MTEGLYYDDTEERHVIYRENEIATAVGVILENLGYDVGDQHFERTPERVARLLIAYRKNGKPEDVKKLLDIAFTEEGAVDSLVLEGPISYDSYCAHHMLPVTGTAYVGYLPSDRVCGLSKLARVTHYFAAQLTVQERVTQEIADALMTHLAPKGAMVVIQAKHGCMSMRGVRERDALTTTSTVRGLFKDSPAARHEFLTLMSLRSKT